MRLPKLTTFKDVFLLKILLLKAYIFYRKKLIITSKLIINNYPLIRIYSDSKIIIENNVRLNSRNKKYHVNMFAPVKLMVDRPGAIIKIGENSRIHGSCIHAFNKIHIGKNCLIAANCQIFDGNGHDLSFDNVDNRINTIGGAKEVIIEDSVWLGANCIIMPGVHIGKGSVISAGSVVVKDIPEMCIAGGNPAKVIKKISI